MNYENLISSIKEAEKVEAARPTLHQIMESVGVKSYNPCDGKYHHILKSVLPFLMENGFEPIKGGQTYKSFKKGQALIEVGRSMVDSCPSVGVLIQIVGMPYMFIPLHNSKDDNYLNLLSLLELLFKR